MNQKHIPNPQLMRTFPYNWAYPFNTFVLSSNHYPPATQTNSFTHSTTNPQFTYINSIKAQEKSQHEKKESEPIVEQQSCNGCMEQEQVCKRSNPQKFPKVAHQAVFFDPTAAPTVTCPSYNQVSMRHEEQLSEFGFRGKPNPETNELKYSEKDENPFIVFKYRRIKKKFRILLNSKIRADEIEQIDSSYESESQGRLKGGQRSSKEQFKGKLNQEASFSSNESEESEK